jgi:hypothetical protein
MNQSLLPKRKKGEPHRIYWQQWIQKSSTTTDTSSVAYSWEHTQSSLEEQNAQRFNRRELIISSAAIRLSRSAKVIDVTTLLRQTLQLPTLPTTVTTVDSNTPTGTGSSHHTDTATISSHHDCLVLVGTIYTLHKSYIEYQHTVNRQSQQLHHQQSIVSSDDDNANEYVEPYHIIRTLHINERPLVAYEAMEKYISNFLDRYNIYMTATSLIDSTTSTTSYPNLPAHPYTPPSTTAITPKIQWYYIPAAIITESNTSSHANNINNITGTMIPNCVELDGYCTSMEDDDDEDDIRDKEDDGYKNNTRECGDTGNIDDYPLLLSREEQIQQKLYSAFPWLNEQNSIMNPDQSLHTPNIMSPMMIPKSKQYSKKVQNMLHYQDYLYSELCMSESQTPIHACLSGYLLYRHMKDRHVWRRMFCILTNHELWYISRIYTRTDTIIDNQDTGNVVSDTLDGNDIVPSALPENDRSKNSKLRYRYVRHARIRLTRAILIQPTPDEPSLFRIPYAFEVVSSDGVSHIFRTNSKQQQTIWISAISERIILSYESSILDNAELFMTEECYARNRRSTTIAVEPIWEQMIRVMSDPSSQSSSFNNISDVLVYPPTGNSIGSVLRFGMDVSIYKDRCRNVRSSIPTRTPIVVATPAPRRRFFSSVSSSSITATSRDDKQTTTPSASSEVKYEPYEPYIQNMIRITWDQATALLLRARSLALTLQLRSWIQQDSIEQQSHYGDGSNDNSIPGTNTGRIRLSHSVDTLCRHIEFVLTGSIDYSTKQNVPKDVTMLDNDTTTTILSPQQSTTNSRQNDGPPPDDLFDQLLIELQSLAAVADRRFITHPNHHPQNQNVSNPNIIVSQQS